MAHAFVLHFIVSSFHEPFKYQKLQQTTKKNQNPEIQP